MGKRLISIFAVLTMLFSLNICGCGENKVKEAADVYFKIILKHDAKDIEKIGVSDSDKKEALKEYENELKNTLKENIVGVGYTPSQTETNELYEMHKNAFAKVEWNVDKVSKSGRKADVEISINYLDFNAIDEKATIETIDEVNNMEFKDNYEENKKYGQIYLAKLTEGLKNAQPGKEKRKMKFEFEKESGYWGPQDADNFAYQLSKLASGDKHPELKLNEEVVKPEESAQAYCNLFINSDSTALEKLGSSKELGAKLIERRNKQDIRDFLSAVSEEKNLFTQEQVEKMVEAYENAKSKNKPKIEVVSQKGDTAQIKITSTSIDMDAMLKNIEGKIVSQAVAQGVSDDKGLMKIFCADLIEELNNAKPGTVTKSHTFKFTKYRNVWTPDDLGDFDYNLDSLCMKCS